MKKIFGMLMFLAVFGMLIGSAAAADLEEHDFNGHFTLKVPGHYWMGTNSKGDSYENDKGVKISHYTVAQIKERGNENFEDYINELVGKGLKPMGNDGNISIYKNNDKYTVFVQSDEEIYAITDPDLDEAKEIARSANLGNDAKTAPSDNSTSKTSNTTSTGDMEKVAVGEVLKVNAPKGSNFNNGTYDGFWIVYSAPECDAVVYYTDDKAANTKIDDAYYDDFIKNITSQKGIKSSKEGNVTVVEGIQNIDGTNAAYVHGDNAMVIVVSNDLNLVKDMAKSIEFTK